MARIRKCAICGKNLDTEDSTQSVPYKGRFAHISCFNIVVKEVGKSREEKAKAQTQKKKTKKKPEIELKAALSEEEYAEKKKMYDYLRSIEKELNAKHYALVENYKKKYDFSYKGIYETLLYIIDTIEKKDNGNILGLVPYYYNEAHDFLSSIKETQAQNEDFDVSKTYKEKVIYIEKPKKKVKQLDITLIHTERR